MYKRILLSLFITASLLFFLVSYSQAETCGNGQYGTTVCPPTDVTIDKTVHNPITGVFVQNLLSGDAAYSPNSEVIYRLKIVNSSNQSFDLVKIEDILPLKAVSASVSEADKGKVKNESTFEVVNNNVTETHLKFELANRFEGNTEVNIDIKVKIKASNAFTASKSLYCGNGDGLQNTAKVWANDRFDDDSSEICVANNVLGTTTLPKAGVTDFLPILPFIGTGLAGISLLFKRGKRS